MSAPQICTEGVLPDELKAFADTVAIQTNPLNGHQVTAGGPIQGGGPPVSLALPVGRMWNTGREITVRILNGTPKIREKIKYYASLWTEHANITFKWVDSGDADLRVNVNGDGSSWSYLGTDNLVVKAPTYPYTMNYGWLTDSTPEHEYARVIIHEFGHALGCIHEHQSPAANIPWNEQAVIEYYRRTNGWDEAKTRANVMKRESAPTQFSAFDTSSIMIYAVPAELTIGGYSVPWSTKLSETDKSFIATAYPRVAVDANGFNTMEIRPWDKPAEKAMKRQVFSKTYDRPPNVAVGLNWLDVDKNANIRVNAFADNIKNNSADVHINTWADTTLYSAGCSWFHAAANSPEFQIGQWSTTDDHPWYEPRPKTEKRINFDWSYSATPKVLVWLNLVDMANNANWRVKAHVTDVTKDGFTLNLDTWANTSLYAASAAWIAYPSDQKGIVSGTFSTEDIRPWNEPRLTNTGRVNFPAGAFAGTGDAPLKVFIALNGFDIGDSANLRLKVSADSVSKEGMNWHLDSWADTVLYQASASYIAFV
ncbi:hypothetical protein QBC35DRAFT_172305 [Podospora australis]|uniref:Peptidase metallopeptidase domain-containing protein n=1 Tax=Podospora australis TaxID=1536484 RepID=A0AAN6WIC7_9PEZI|nr:hypothetical protein QBC35DRAFT_172305 [Podospora australis]